MQIIKMQDFFLNHLALSVLDVEQSVAFYTTVFGFKEIKNTASNSKTRWLQLDGKIQLHLIYRPKFELKTIKADHFALSTTNLKGFVKHLDRLGIMYSDWIDSENKDYIRKDGVFQIYFQDPNQHWIEVNNAV